MVGFGSEQGRRGEGGELKGRQKRAHGSGISFWKRGKKGKERGNVVGGRPGKRDERVR